MSTPNFSGACRSTKARILPKELASLSLIMNLPSSLHIGQLEPLKCPLLIEQERSLHWRSMNIAGWGLFLVSTECLAN